MVRTAARPRIEPIEPADEAALDAWWALQDAGRRADRPSDPPPCRRELGAELRVPWPGEMPAAWLARAGDVVVGAAALYLPTLDNLGNAFGELVVHPAHRRRGTGRALLEQLAAAARAAGRVRLIGEVHSPLDADGPGVGFASAAGAVRALATTRRRLALPPAPADVPAAPGGYEPVGWLGPTPERWRADIAVLTGRMTLDAPLDDLHLDPERYDARRVRDRAPPAPPAACARASPPCATSRPAGWWRSPTSWCGRACRGMRSRPTPSSRPITAAIGWACWSSSRT